MAAYVVGIDLGTTHTVVASSPVDRVAVETLAVPQLVGPGELDSLDTLASCLYLPARGELDDDDRRLPWGEAPPHVLGHYAVQRGAQVPGRSVISAKSWLSYAGVDRGAAILPWGSPDEVPRISPVEASARILAHVRAAWDHAHPEAPLAEQDVVLTVPASFDEVARHLTGHAAVEAGLRGVRLLEEPQAALYDFLRLHADDLGAALAGHRLLLVVDVGGGTSDFTLVQVQPQDGGPPELERVAVGDHLMLGGDNMDAALARHVEQKLTGSIGSLGAAQWGALVQSARLAKEALLSAQPPAEMRVVLPGRGARLVGGSQSHAVARETALELLLDGFVPRTRPDEVPARGGRSALAELGLPYAQDPAISRHLCAFLRRHAGAAAAAGARVVDGLPHPDAVLLNGGVFHSVALRRRLQEVLAGWLGAAPPLLEVDAVHLAVARGAATYGLVRRGLGVRIGGGSPRAYYVGVEAADGARQALCLVPRGMHEGSSHRIDRTFNLRLGQPVRFPLYTSTAEGQVQPGALRPVDEVLDPMPPLSAVLQAPLEVPVRLRAALTEIGTLELTLEMIEQNLPRWDLSFGTRDAAPVDAEAPSGAAPAEPAHRNLDQAKALLERYYGDKKSDVDPASIKALRRQLEAALGSDEQWSIAVSRELFGAFLVGARRRRRSADHERWFWHLAGHCLRPGFGAPFDEWRLGELWPMFDEGVQHTKDKAVWAAWWICWRRVAGGLDAAQQQRVFDAVWPWLDSTVHPRPKGARPHADDEMVRLLAALERLPAATKAQVGTWVLRRLAKGALASWWPIGRLGARQPFAGSAHDVLPSALAEEWLARLLGLDWKTADGAALAAAQLARRTGDRERDVDEKLRLKVARRLEQHRAGAAWARQVLEVAPLTEADQAQVLGDSLPVGLRLT